MSKMMQNVTVVISRRIMKRGKTMTACLFEDCDCKKFETFQVNLLKKKKTVSDIKFLTEAEVKDDVLAWNCFSVNKYTEKK